MVQDAQQYMMDEQAFTSAKQNNKLLMTQNGRIDGSQTDKVKKNTRKLNSGIPAKILIGRNGLNNIIIPIQAPAHLQA